jgi:Amt family ammonium transporter
VIAGGWIERNWIQLGYQLSAICAVMGWSFVVTNLILFLMNLIPGLSLRVHGDDEALGLDDCQLGEFAYDYVELTRHVSDQFIPGVEGSIKSSHTPEKVA